VRYEDFVFAGSAPFMALPDGVEVFVLDLQQQR
jgi:hypothetical protein